MPAMGLPELDVARVQRWCAGRVPERARHQVRVECDVAPRHLTIVERRAHGKEVTGSGHPSRSRGCTTPRPVRRGRCTGATATCAFTSTTASDVRPVSTTCLPRSSWIQRPSSGADQPRNSRPSSDGSGQVARICGLRTSADAGQGITENCFYSFQCTRMRSEQG
jgi:hypothetical protein